MIERYGYEMSKSQYGGGYSFDGAEDIFIPLGAGNPDEAYILNLFGFNKTENKQN